MLITGLVLAAVAVLVHVYIFYMESIAWTTQKARSVFGTTPEEAVATKELAFNQGFYNLFLGVVAAFGIVLTTTGQATAGLALVYAGTGSMAAAATVLFLSSPDKRSAAVKQGLVPLLAVVLLLVAQTV